MHENGSFCFLSDFDKEFMTYFHALSEREQCILARAVAAQVGNRRCQPLVEHVELSLVKKGA